MAITFTTIIDFGPHAIPVTDNGAALCYMYDTLPTPYQHKIVHSCVVTTPYLQHIPLTPHEVEAWPC